MMIYLFSFHLELVSASKKLPGVQHDGIWVQFDDDKMIPRKDEDILELAGGGDWHTAYLMLFKPQRVPESSKEAAPLSEAGS
jgi:hypothetical protein